MALEFLDTISELISTANESLDTADSALGSFDKASGLISRLKGLFKSSETGTETEIKTVLAELTNEIADAKLANIDLKIKLAALQQVLFEAQQRQSKLDRYVMTKTPAGNFVYALKSAETDAEPEHFACPTCFQDERISILQGGGDVLQCFKCNQAIRFNHGRSLRR